MTNDNYSQITWQEVRAGDVLMHENGDRLTVTAYSHEGGLVHAAKMGRWWEGWDSAGFTPYRRKPDIPSEPGAYLDKDGNAWLLGTFISQPSWFDGEGGGYEPEDIDEFAPFARLVPVPSSDAVLEVVKRVIPLSRYEAVTDAVMALLNGEGDDD